MSDPQMKLLVVEDNDLDVIVLQRLMRRMSINYPIVRAINGEDALQILRPEHGESKVLPPFVMLIDINMPRMNGFELLEALAGDEVLAGVPTYIMSTSNNPKDIQRAKTFSITGYLLKPVTEPIMRGILEPAGE